VKYLINTPEFKHRRRKLRKIQTPFEGFLWNKLRNRQLNGYKFQRQFSIGPYILDFYCFTKQLAVELDGSQHLNDETNPYALERKRFLESRQITILRFWNGTVKEDFDHVIDKILQNLER
jgi:very-short-patch-repair endonuclease